MKPIEGKADELTNIGGPSITRFFLENGRLPFVGDPVKPWEYRGWLIPYILLAEQHPDIPARYDYVIRTIENQELLDEPVPQVRFVGEGSAEAKPGMKMFGEILKTAEYRSGWHRALEHVCEWLGFGLAVTSKPSELPAEEQEQLYRKFDVSTWLLAPTDYIGQFMAEAGHGKAAGFFPTPISICEAMTRMTFTDGDNRSKTVMDPCVGTGRFLLTASNHSLRLYGQDINYLAVLASKINLAIFAPWFHLPSSVFPVDPDAGYVPGPVPQERLLDGPGIAKESAILRPATGPQKPFTTKIEQPSLFGMDE